MTKIDGVVSVVVVVVGFCPDVLLGAPIELRMQDVDGHVQSSPGLKPGDIGACTRLRIPGQSRIDNMDKFAHTTWATVSALRPSLARVEVCFHGWVVFPSHNM